MTPTTLLFDYGGTLDSGARHWNFVLLDGYRQAAERFPALRAVDGEVWRAAYVHGERTLARQPIVTPDDDFRTLLHKKIAVELAFLREGGTITLSDADCAAATDAIADFCDHAARRHADEARHVLQTLRDRGYRFVLVTNFYGNIHPRHHRPAPTPRAPPLRFYRQAGLITIGCAAKLMLAAHPNFWAKSK